MSVSEDKTIRFFISSPNDVAEERGKARQVVEKVCPGITTTDETGDRHGGRSGAKH
ncbi:MAG: hypothetical protein ACI9R3_003296 [Verrucomicrobiales bacterium]|jgi:hypothetical protein